MYGIKRSSDSEAWAVRLSRKGKTLYKQFCFSLYGGEQAALVRAQVWRDEIVRAHPLMPRSQMAAIVRRNNTSGIAGVSCRLGPDGEPRCWTARTLIAANTELRASFSVTRYGAQAKQLAIAEREKQLKQLIGLTHVHSAEAIVRVSSPRELPPDLPVPVTKPLVARRDSRSGIAGVYHQTKRESDPGRWCARTNIGGGKILVKSFYVKQHGEEKAKELAIAERKRQLEQVRGVSARP
ncbi:MAG: AP2 domain-containing protein [Variovorax sp.]|nr:AP2 domain-containing protein [Variovorax sp.]